MIKIEYRFKLAVNMRDVDKESTLTMEFNEPLA